MSSNEDADEKDGNVSSFETQSKISRLYMFNLAIGWVWILRSVWWGLFCADINGMDPDVVVSTGPFRNIGLSKAALTHRLRKLRTPSKCRECDSYVYFQGAECEEVSSSSLHQANMFWGSRSELHTESLPAVVRSAQCVADACYILMIVVSVFSEHMQMSK